MFKKILFSYILSLLFSIANCQKLTEGVPAKKIIETVDAYNSKFPSEQLFIHFDKPYYSVGDTIWFKAYLLHSASLDYSPLSGLLYLELITDSNKVIKRISVPVSYGITCGQIALIKGEITEGNYSVRAYTNWMQNFGEEVFFRQQLKISDIGKSNWLIKENHKLTVNGDREEVAIDLQLKTLNEDFIKNRIIDFKILNGNKVVYKKELETNSVGLITDRFALPTSNKIRKGLSIILQDKNDRGYITFFPLQLNRAENIDLQFMPEGGYLVAGILSRVGFKAVGENGLGTDINGKIVDSKNNEVASFQSLYKGMGVFEITPVNGQNYFAIVNLPSGIVKQYPLPEIKSSGIVLRIDSTLKADSIKFKIFGSEDMINDRAYHFIGLSRGVVYYAADFNFKTSIVSGKIAKSYFPSGIAHFTLMNDAGQPVNERIWFIDHSDRLQIDVETINSVFTTRDSIPINLKVTDNEGKDVAGSFSVAITDDSQIQTDSLNAENIISRMLLTGELKGNVESPGYYLSSKNGDVEKNLDALLLTQGWIGYNWKKFSQPANPAFVPEANFTVSGSVTNLFDNPINKAQVVLISVGSTNLFKDTLTNEKGQFIFKNFSDFDSTTFILQARNAKGKNFGLGLTVNKFEPAEIKKLLPVGMPWYINTDAVMAKYAQNNFTRQLEYEKKYKTLATVKITAKQKIKGSHNLNGAGADQIINEVEIQNAGKKMDLLSLLREKVKGFTVKYLGNGNQSYSINFNPVKFIIDGVDISFFGFGRETLEYLEAADITGIEVMNNMRYAFRYQSHYLTIEEQMNNRTQFAFIEITTRSGNGAFMKRTPGVSVYKPIPLTFPKEFYSPAYKVNISNKNDTDMRSTIYWKPNVVTNVHGEANFYFFSADIPGSYTIILQGSDLQGNIGYKLKRITIK